MKINNIASIAALLLASLSVVQAQTTITAWTFDNVAVGFNTNPPASTGVGSAAALGMGNNYPTPGTSTNVSDVQINAGGSVSGAAGQNTWRVRGGKNTATAANGWSSAAPIGTQGVQFKVSTTGYYGIRLTCDVNESAQGERNLQFQYTIDGTNWINATNITLGTLGTLATNTSSANTVTGVYYKLASGFDNAITVDFSQIPEVNNNTNFAVRMVNASTGVDCVNAAGTALNNSSGNWNFDNVIIKGTAVQPITAWTFENYTNLAILTGSAIVNVDHPSPTTGSGTAKALGFSTEFTFADTIASLGSISYPDVTIQTGSSSGGAGPCCWRVRGQNPTAPAGSNDHTGNGWDSQADIGTQGGEFDVSTVNYNTIVVTFDLFFTGQAEAKMQAQYTTDGATWINAPLACPSNPSLITNNIMVASGTDGTVVGTYMNMTVTGGGWFNNMTMDLSGISGVTNNPNFGIRVVNAAKGADCTAPNGGPYNNSSGNSRFDNVVVSGQFSGPLAPVIIPDANATVDHPFTNTFTLTPAWQYNITSITVNGSTLPTAAYNTNNPGKIIFTPSFSTLLQSSGSQTIKIQATGYGSDIVFQPIGAGAASNIVLSAQPASPAASSGTLIAQPTLQIIDQYGNGTTNPYNNVTFTATVGGAGGWTLGGSNVQAVVNGVANFTNLSATVNGSAAVSNAVIMFTTSGYGVSPFVTNSASFNIGAPAKPFTPGNLAVLQVDNVALNSTFSIIEISPSKANQTMPINIVPISASNGTNSMRQSSSGSTGRLGLSDDGTLLCFVGFLDGSSLTTDETSFTAYRGVGTLDYTSLFNSPIQYGPVSVAGGTQGRSASTLDNVNYVIADKNGIFINNANLVIDNTRVIRAFGGTIYLMSATSPKTVVNYVGAGNSIIPLPGLGTDGNAMDFYMVSSGSSGAGVYDVLYILDSKVNTISKFSNVGGTWTANGSTANPEGCDGLLAATNGNGGVYLYYTTGSGGTASNSVVCKTDAAGYNTTMNIVATNTIFTATATTTLKGLSFVPQQTANATEPTPPPVLTAASGAMVGNQFSISLSPEDATWRSDITNITVNGVSINGAYDATQSGEIVFQAPASSSPLYSPGLKSIVVGATGYGLDLVAQTIGLVQPTIIGSSLSGGNLTFAFNSVSNLTFSVRSTNLLTAPVAIWPVIGTAAQTSPGQYQFIDLNPATNATQFYILSQP
jgi:Protein of unknown function (DUF1533)